MEGIVAALSGIPSEWTVFLISMLPVVELRGAIPVGMALGLSAREVFFPAVAGNALVTALLLWLLPKLFALLCRLPHLTVCGEKFCERLQRKHRLPRQGQTAGLLLFVAVPLPGTGVWTGCLLAYLLGMERKSALLAVLLGMMLAACLMTLGSFGLFSVVSDAKIALFLVAFFLIALWGLKKRLAVKKRRCCSYAEMNTFQTNEKKKAKHK